MRASARERLIADERVGLARGDRKADARLEGVGLVAKLRAREHEPGLDAQHIERGHA